MIGTDYAEMATHYETYVNRSKAESLVGPFKPEKSLAGSSIERVSFTVSFSSLTTIDIYLTPSPSAEGKVKATATFKGKEYKVEKTTDGRWHVRIEGIKPLDFGTPVQIEGRLDDNFSVNASVLSYVWAVFNKGIVDDVAGNALACAYQYYNYANALAG